MRPPDTPDPVTPGSVPSGTTLAASAFAQRRAKRAPTAPIFVRGLGGATRLVSSVSLAAMGPPRFSFPGLIR